MQPVCRVQYATTTTGNLGIAQPSDLVDELSLAAVGIDQMGVGVAERGENAASLRVYHR